MVKRFLKLFGQLIRVIKNKAVIPVFIFLVILIVQCATPKKIEYNIPDDIQGSKREELLATLESGRKLYRLYCASCHGILTKGKDGMPDFTDKQIDLYTAYYIIRDPKNHAVAANMSPDQLHTVFMFLKVRKHKGEPEKIKEGDKASIDPATR